ncbi:MAG TPA: hypothetical protein VF517_04355 [Thermoleophilaceae bacterium]|jgi:hypothetical protein
MDTTELTRVVIALPAAGVVPAMVPRLGRAGRALAAVPLAMWAAAPTLDDWRGWALVALAVVAAQLARSIDGEVRESFARAVLCTVVLAGASALLLDGSAAAESIEDALLDDQVAIVAAGALLTVFVGGAAIAWLLTPFAALVHETAADAGVVTPTRAGLYIGWLERTLIYGFVVAGAPGAVAVVVAVKSIARFPSFTEEKFAEYFLIGTLASVVVAVGLGVAVRAILGLMPVLA